MNKMPPLSGAAAVPHRDGEPVFQEPWQARAFAMVLQMYENGGFVWDDFRDRLIAEIQAADAASVAAAEPICPGDPQDSHYYDHWLASFEQLLKARNLVTEDEITARAAEIVEAQAAARAAQLHGHGHDHGHDHGH